MNTPNILLLVDDDTDDISIFESVLIEVNPSKRFLSAEDGKDALEQLRSMPATLPELIFLDLNMPRMNGKEFLTELKKDHKLKDIPVIIYSTSSYKKDKEDVLNLGAIGFITKPTNTNDLKNILHAIVASLPERLQATIQDLSKTNNGAITAW